MEPHARFERAADAGCMYTCSYMVVAKKYFSGIILGAEKFVFVSIFKLEPN